MIKSILLHLVRLMERLLVHAPAIGSFRPLKGHFRAIDLLEKGALPGALLLKRQDPGPCPADSITEKAGMNQNDHQPWPVFWVRADDARLVGKLLDWRNPDDQTCSEGAFHLHQRRRLGEDSLLARIIVPKPLELPGAWTSIASNWGDGRNYYHWMTDNLTRLMVRERLPESTRILIPEGRHRFIRETLEMLGLADLAETPASPCLRPERFYFCSPVSMTGVWNPAGFNWLRERFAAFLKSTPEAAPVFLTRRGGTRIPPNIQEIESLFESHGFQIIDCGSIGVKEQMALASGARAIAGLHGAAMTNLLWAHPGIPVLELFQSQYLNACYEQIAFQGGLVYKGLNLDEPSSADQIRRWLQSLPDP